MNAEEIAKGALRIDWWNTESQARRVAEHAEDLLGKARVAALEEAIDKLLDMANEESSIEYKWAAAAIRALCK